MRAWSNFTTSQWETFTVEEWAEFLISPLPFSATTTQLQSFDKVTLLDAFNQTVKAAPNQQPMTTKLNALNRTRQVEVQEKETIW